MWKKPDGFLLILTNGNMEWGMEKSWGLSYENHTRGRASGGVAILPCTAALQLKLTIFIYFLTSENKSREEESGKSEPLQLALFLMFVWVFFSNEQPCASMIWTTCFRNFRMKCHFSLCQPALRKETRKFVCLNWGNKSIILRNFIWLQKDPEISRIFW